MRLITERNLKAMLEDDPVQMDGGDTYQVYAMAWGKFICESCHQEESYRVPGEEFVREIWISRAAGRAREDGWFVGPWRFGPLWLSQRCMDCTAFCPRCRHFAHGLSAGPGNKIGL